MKKVSLLSLLFLLAVVIVKAQDQNVFQATLKNGSANNRVKAVIRPLTDVSGHISNWQFTFRVPTTITPQPSITISNNPFSTGVTYNILTNSDANFYYYTLDGLGAPTGGPLFDFTNGTEYDAVEITFSIAISPAPTSNVQLVQIPKRSLG